MKILGSIERCSWLQKKCLNDISVFGHTKRCADNLKHSLPTATENKENVDDVQNMIQ